MIKCFEYDLRSGSLKADGKSCVYYKSCGKNIYPYIKKNGTNRYLTSEEKELFLKTAQWFIENNDSDFGELVNNAAKEYKEKSNRKRFIIKGYDRLHGGSKKTAKVYGEFEDRRECAEHLNSLQKWNDANKIKFYIEENI